MAKFNQTIEQQYIDCETGEVKSIATKKIFTSKVKSDEFYMTFVDYMSPIFKIKKTSVKNLLSWLCKNADYNTGKTTLTASDRKKICTEWNTTNSTISSSLKQLKELNLISGDDGVYYLNPKVFWKGELAKRKELLDNNDINIIFSIG